MSSKYSIKTCKPVSDKPLSILVGRLLLTTPHLVQKVCTVQYYADYSSSSTESLYYTMLTTLHLAQKVSTILC